MQKMIYRIMITLVLFGTALAPIGFANMSQAIKSPHVVRQIKVDNKTAVNINIASVKVLATLKGIGPKKAQAIIDYREKNGNFKSWKDVSAVKGIGEKGLARIMKNNPGRMVINP